MAHVRHADRNSWPITQTAVFRHEISPNGDRQVGLATALSRDEWHRQPTSREAAAVSKLSRTIKVLCPSSCTIQPSPAENPARPSCECWRMSNTNFSSFSFRDEMGSINISHVMPAPACPNGQAPTSSLPIPSIHLGHLEAMPGPEQHLLRLRTHQTMGCNSPSVSHSSRVQCLMSS